MPMLGASVHAPARKTLGFTTIRPWMARKGVDSLKSVLASSVRFEIFISHTGVLSFRNSQGRDLQEFSFQVPGIHRLLEVFKSV
jgi:hypothetical protein